MYNYFVIAVYIGQYLPITLRGTFFCSNNYYLIICVSIKSSKFFITFSCGLSSINLFGMIGMLDVYHHSSDRHCVIAIAHCYYYYYYYCRYDKTSLQFERLSNSQRSRRSSPPSP